MLVIITKDHLEDDDDDDDDDEEVELTNNNGRGKRGLISKYLSK